MIGDANAVGVLVGIAVGVVVSGSTMARLRILADAVSIQGFDAYTCTDGQVCCTGVPKLFVIVGIVTAPVTVRVIIKFTLSMRIVTVDHALSGRALDKS